VTKVLEYKFAVVFSPPKEVAKANVPVLSKKAIIAKISEFADHIITKKIPNTYGCTLVHGWRMMEEKEYWGANENDQKTV
jgi:hypothetical protein